MASLFYAYYAYDWLRRKAIKVLRSNPNPSTALAEVSSFADASTLTESETPLDTAVQNQIAFNMLESVECPVCLQVAIPPLFQCAKGHFVCSVCRPKLEYCGLCRSEFTYSRNFAIEHIVATMESKCGHSACPKILKISEILDHMNKDCDYRSVPCYHCPRHKRNGLVEWEDYTKHLKEVHHYRSEELSFGKYISKEYILLTKNQHIQDLEKQITMTGYKWEIATLISKEGPIFFLHMEADRIGFPIVFIWISALVSGEAGKYVADLLFFKEQSNNTKPRYRCMYSIDVSPLRITLSQVDSSRYCAAIPIRSLFELSRPGPDGVLKFSVHVALRMAN